MIDINTKLHAFDQTNYGLIVDSSVDARKESKVKLLSFLALTALSLFLIVFPPSPFMVAIFSLSFFFGLACSYHFYREFSATKSKTANLIQLWSDRNEICQKLEYDKQLHHSNLAYQFIAEKQKKPFKTYSLCFVYRDSSSNGYMAYFVNNIKYMMNGNIDWILAIEESELHHLLDQKNDQMNVEMVIKSE